MFVTALLMSCSEKDTLIAGDLYFKLIDFSLYNAEEEAITKYEQIIDSLRAIKMPTTKESYMVRHHDILKRNKLLLSPHILVKIDEEINRVYLSVENYEPFKAIRYVDLLKEGRKVSLVLRVKELEKNLYYLDEIEELEIVKGETFVDK